MASPGTPRAAAAALLLAALLACNPMSSADAQAQLCKDLGELRSAVANLTKTDANATVGQLRESRARVQQEMADVQKSAQAVSSAETSDLQRAFGELDRAINTLPSDISIGQAVTTIQPQVQAVEVAWSRYNTTSRCRQGSS
jgi:ElaB/YqjD/DUF883 family membrane-anchored ribosome-binding protein